MSDSTQEVIRSPGLPLEAAALGFFSDRFRHDFSGVRVHADAPAAATALALGARAYTVGSHIVFAPGQYQPGRSAGMRLLGHELAHVVQQGGGGAPPGPAQEHDAEAASRAAVAGGEAKVGAPSVVGFAAQPRQEAPPDRGSCGPDVTGWFVNVVKEAKASKDMLRIKSDFSEANALMTDLGLPDIRLLAEYFVDEEVTKAWEAAGKPEEKGEAKGQRASAFSGYAAMTQAELKVSKLTTGQLLLLTRAKSLTADAAKTWKELLKDRGPYDFKNTTLVGARSAHCPAGPNCKGTITLCNMCFLAYVTGDLFYAHVGRFVGWSDLALRLGSQYAQLISKKKDWDPPEDSAMLSIGLRLPDPLTSAALRDALHGQADPLTQPCKPCAESWSDSGRPPAAKEPTK